MNRVFLNIGPITIYWYTFLVLIAVLLGYEIAMNYSKKINYHPLDIGEMALYLIIYSIIGARLYYVIFNFDGFKDDLLGIFQIWRGGLAIYGGIIGGGLYVLYYCNKRKINFIKMLDIFSLSLLLGQAIGRWGNFFNSEAYGGITTKEVLQSLHIPNFIIEGMYIEEAYRQPTFLYESLWCLIGVVILSMIRKKVFAPTGKQISFYLMWYGFGRFFIEGLRSDSLYIGTFRISQIVSIIFIITGLIGWLYTLKTKNITKDNGGTDEKA